MQHAKRRGRYGGSERTPSKAPSRVVSPLALMCVVASTASACDSRDGRNDATKGSVISSAKPDVDQANRALGSTAVGPDKPETSMAITPAAKSGDALTSVSVAPLSLGRMLNRLRRTDARPFHQPNAAQA